MPMNQEQKVARRKELRALRKKGILVSQRMPDGRPRTYTSEMPIYDSMEQAASATGIPLMLIRNAKKSGCLCVRHGKVHVAEFIKWFFNQPEDGDGEDSVDWTKRDKRASALIKEAKLEEERERVIDFSLVTRLIQKVVNVTFFGELERIANEFPTNLAGKTPVQIHHEILEQNKKIKKTLLNLLDIWEKTRGKKI